MTLHNVANVNELFTHLPNIDAFSVDTDGSTLVYLVGREKPIKITADIELAVDVFEEEVAKSELEDGFDELTPEEVQTLLGALTQIEKEGTPNE